MLKLKRLSTLEEFEKLKKNDLIIVVWKENTKDGRNKPVDTITTFNIYENKKNQQEIICTLKNNLYFNYFLYCFPGVDGYSRAKDIYVLEEQEEAE